MTFTIKKGDLVTNIFVWRIRLDLDLDLNVGGLNFVLCSRVECNIV